MSKPPIVIDDPDLLARLRAATTVVDLRDPDGTIIAAFVPTAVRDRTRAATAARSDPEASELDPPA